METNKWRFKHSIEKQIFNEPYRFEYFQLLSLIELSIQRRSPLVTNPIAELIRFRSPITLDFPSSEVSRVDGDAQWVTTGEIRDGNSGKSTTVDERKIFLKQHVIGFFGIAGALPYHYTEQIAKANANSNNDDPTAFLDIFINRPASLFYDAWRSFRPEVTYRGRRDEKFVRILNSFAGTLEISNQAKDEDDRVKLQSEDYAYLAGPIRHRPLSTIFLQKILRDHFAVPIVIEPFVGDWYEIHFSQRYHLGAADFFLGNNLILGSTVWQRDLKQKIVVGPLNETAYRAFQPNQYSNKALKNLLDLFAGPFIEFEIELILAAAYVRVAKLSANEDCSSLGRQAYLAFDKGFSDKRDFSYNLNQV